MYYKYFILFIAEGKIQVMATNMHTCNDQGKDETAAEFDFSVFVTVIMGIHIDLNARCNDHQIGGIVTSSMISSVFVFDREEIKDRE